MVNAHFRAQLGEGRSFAHPRSSCGRGRLWPGYPTRRPFPPSFTPSTSRMTKFLTLAPTVRTLATGVPTARGLNLAATAGHSAHHAHSVGGPRANFDLPKWASSISGTASRTKIVGQSPVPVTSPLSPQTASSDWARRCGREGHRGPGGGCGWDDAFAPWASWHVGLRKLGRAAEEGQSGQTRGRSETRRRPSSRRTFDSVIPASPPLDSRSQSGRS